MMIPGEMSGEGLNNAPESPEIRVPVDGVGELILTWHNTLFHLFTIGDGKFDHVTVMLENDTKVAQFPPTDELRAMLIENDYPRLTRPFLKEEDQNRIASYETARIEQDLLHLQD